MKRLALVLAAVTLAVGFGALADPVPVPQPKCTPQTYAGKGTVCQECKPAVCAELEDAGYHHQCNESCKAEPCFEVWCKAKPKAKSKD